LCEHIVRILCECGEMWVEWTEPPKRILCCLFAGYLAGTLCKGNVCYGLSDVSPKFLKFERLLLHCVIAHFISLTCVPILSWECIMRVECVRPYIVSFGDRWECILVLLWYDLIVLIAGYSSGTNCEGVAVCGLSDESIILFECFVLSLIFSFLCSVTYRSLLSLSTHVWIESERLHKVSFCYRTELKLLTAYYFHSYLVIPGNTKLTLRQRMEAAQWGNCNLQSKQLDHTTTILKYTPTCHQSSQYMVSHTQPS